MVGVSDHFFADDFVQALTLHGIFGNMVQFHKEPYALNGVLHVAKILLLIHLIDGCSSSVRYTFPKHAGPTEILVRSGRFLYLDEA